jgi:hypothetical protein
MKYVIKLEDGTDHSINFDWQVDDDDSINEFMKAVEAQGHHSWEVDDWWVENE